MRKLFLLLPMLVHAASPCPGTDCRPDLEANAYAGLAIDSFAAPDLSNYLNPEASGAVKQRAIAGFDFEYRLLGDASNPGETQFWLYGKTEHGVRGADVDSRWPQTARCLCAETFSNRIWSPSSP